MRFVLTVKKRFSISFLTKAVGMLFVIVLCCLLLTSPSWAVQWDVFAPLLDSPSQYDYTPSWMADSVVGYDRIWWCSTRSGGVGVPPGEGDVIKYKSVVVPNPQAVLAPNMSGWEGVCVCDPAVVRGDFGSFHLAMYYTASPNCSTDNKIGVAYSNDGLNWTKSPSNPIIVSAGRGTYPIDQVPPFLQEPIFANYGAGQPQARNFDGVSGIQLWYTDTRGAAGHGIYERISYDSVNFQPANRLSSNGINCAPDCLAGAGIALSAYPPYELYLLIRNTLSTHMDLYKIPYDQRFVGTWTFVDDFSAAEAGYGAVFEGGFRTDYFGNLFFGTWPDIWAAFGAGPALTLESASQWSLGQARAH